MPIPNTKVLLNSTLLAGGGFTLTPNAAGDFSPALTGVASASWVAGVGDLNGDGVADIAIGSAGDDDKAVDAGRIFVTLSSFAAGTTHGIADALPGSLIIDGVNAGRYRHKSTCRLDIGVCIGGSGKWRNGARKEIGAVWIYLLVKEPNDKSRVACADSVVVFSDAICDWRSYEINRLRGARVRIS